MDPCGTPHGINAEKENNILTQDNKTAQNDQIIIVQ